MRYGHFGFRWHPGARNANLLLKLYEGQHAQLSIRSACSADYGFEGQEQSESFEASNNLARKNFRLSLLGAC
jgi:hypothetical protein